MMQAFAYRHLVPAQELLVVGTGGGRWTPSFQLAGDSPIRVPAGGTAEVKIATVQGPRAGTPIRLALSDPPEGVTLQDTSFAADSISLVLKADAAHVGYADNLIVEASMDFEPKRPDGKATGRKMRFSLGALPAIPFEIVLR